MPQPLLVLCQIHYLLKRCIILTGIFSKEAIETGQLLLFSFIVPALCKYSIDRNRVCLFVSICNVVD